MESLDQCLRGLVDWIREKGGFCLDLSGADLREAIMCRATIDGATVHPDDIGGTGHILYALTDDEAAAIEERRHGQATETH